MRFKKKLEIEKLQKSIDLKADNFLHGLFKDLYNFKTADVITKKNETKLGKERAEDMTTEASGKDQVQLEKNSNEKKNDRNINKVETEENKPVNSHLESKQNEPIEKNKDDGSPDLITGKNFQTEKNENSDDFIADKTVKNEGVQSERRFNKWKSFDARLKKLLDRPNLIHWIALVLLALTIWGILYSVGGAGFLPGSQLFSLAVLFVAAFIGGELIKIIKLPPLLGMLLAGLILRNVGFIHLKGVFMEVTATLREIALCIILIRAGLGLDPKALRNLKFAILRLACVPGLVEGGITTIVAHFLLELPWLWSMLLGAILAAVSPAVVIPCLFRLQEQGYGTDKGIPTLIVAAASLDDILAITIFGIVLNVIYSTGTSLPMQIIQGPLGILLGIFFGSVWGYISQFVPHRKDEQVVLLRVLMIIGGGLVAIVGSGAIGYQGAGPLACIIAAFVACLGWRMQDYNDKYNPVASVFGVMWIIFQPILFGLIGSEVDISVLETSTVGYGLLVLFCSLCGRIVISIFVGYGVGFTWKEKTFVAWAWFPKATVQAALGPLALDIARRQGVTEDLIYARKVVILAVLAILITAPIGMVLITTLGPKLLTKSVTKNVEQKETNDNLEFT